VSAVLAAVVIVALAWGARRALPSQAPPGPSVISAAAREDDDLGFRVPALSRLEGLLRTRGTPEEPANFEAELARIVGREGRVQ
jgi:hypothetical protein